MSNLHKLDFRDLPPRRKAADPRGRVREQAASGNNKRHWLMLFSFLIVISCLARIILFPLPAFPEDKKQVLILHSYHKGLESIESKDKGIRSVLAARMPNLEVHTEYIDATRVYDDQDNQVLFNHLQKKFASIPFNLVITTGEEAYNFCLKHHNSLFPGVPIVFCGVRCDRGPQCQMGQEALMSGVVETLDVRSTLSAALRLQPDTSRVMVINDLTNPGLSNKKVLEQTIPEFEKQVQFVFLENLKIEELLDQVRALSKGDIILLMNFSRDKAGRDFETNQILALISKEASVPIYSFWDYYLGKGIVGGMLIDHTEQGKAAAEIALRILNGKADPSIPVIQESPKRYMFDFFEMQIFGLKAANLPENSIIINSPPTSYAINKHLVWMGICGIIALSVIIVVLIVNIRRRKRAEEAVRESEEKYRTLVNNLSIGVYRNTVEQGTFLQVNPAMAKIFGFESPKEMMGVSTIDLYQNPEDRKAFLEEVMREGFVRNKELALKKKDGTSIWCAASSTAQYDGKGEMKWIDGVMEDITARKKAAEELQETHQKLWALIQASPFSISVQDPEGRILMWNPASEKVFGWTQEEVLGRPMPTIPPDKQDEFQDNLGRSIAGNPIKGMELKRQRKDGSLIDVCLYTAPLFDTKGRPTSCMALQVDITEQKHAELALKKAQEELEERVKERTAEFIRANERLNREIIDRKRVAKILSESEERYRLLVSNIPAVVCKGYWNWEIEFFDDKIEQLTGYSKEEFNAKRMKWTDVVYPDDLEGIKQAFAEALKSNRSYVREYRILNKNRKIIWVQERSQIVCTEDGKVDYVGAVFFDITERRQAEDDLRRAHAEIEQLFASITSILIGLTPSGLIWHWNEEAEKVLGLKAAEVLGQKISKLPLHWEEAKISQALRECRKECRPVKVENVRYRRRGGKDRFLGISVSPIKEESGEVSGLILLGSDITERMILEMQLSQAQKLESIGQLAAGIAHEINTPIQYVGDNTRFLRDAFNDLALLLGEYKGLLESGRSGTVAPDLLDRVESVNRQIDLDYLVEEVPIAINQSLDGLERVAKIVRAMKDFSHPGAVEKQAVDLNKAIESTITVARNEWKYVAEMVTDLDPSLPLVPCRPDEINQVSLLQKSL